MTDYYERRELRARYEDEASSLFNLVVAGALAEFREAMALIPDPKQSPRWARQRAAALTKYQLTSTPAWKLRDQALTELMATGEVSEETSFKMDELKVAKAMEEV